MRKEKQFLLDGMVEEIDQSSAFILLSYSSLDANATADFRSEVFKSGGNFSVVSKRIFLKAAKEKGLDFAKDDLKGHVGIVYTGEDTVATTKAVFNFAGSNKKSLDVLMGYFEEKICSPSDVEQISKLPGKDQMRSELLGLFEAPMSQLVSVMEAAMSGVIGCIDSKIKKEEE